MRAAQKRVNLQGAGIQREVEVDSPRPKRSLVGWVLIGGLLSGLPRECGQNVMLGSPLGEADNHLWMWWRSLQDPRMGPWSNRPVGDGILLMDPQNLGPYWIGSQLSPAMGWNISVGSAWLLLVAGAGALGRRLAGPQAGLIAAFFAGCNPVFWGLIDFGISEMWAVGWLGLHLACLEGYQQEGRLHQALLAGVCLGAAASSGWYLALFALAIELAWLLARTGGRPRMGVFVQGGIALAMVSPSLWETWSHKEEWAERIRQAAPHPPGPRADWADLPVYGTDILSWVMPRWTPVEPSKAAYMGIGLLLLAILGLRGRLSWIPMIVGLYLLSLGIWPSLAGVPIGAKGPAGWLTELLPLFAGISHWGRAGAAAIPLLAALAGAGLMRMSRGQTWRLHTILALVLLDAIMLSPTPWPRPTIHMELPQILSELPGSGGVIQLPFDNGRMPFSDEPARLFNRFQVLHQHPVAENYEGVDALLVRSRLIAAADRECWVRSTLPLHQRPPPEWRSAAAPTGDALIAELDQLREWGFEWIVLHRARCRKASGVIQLLEGVIGEGEHPEGPAGDWRWRLRDKSSNTIYR